MKKKKIRKQIKKAEVWGKLLDAQRMQNEKDAAEASLRILEKRIRGDIETAFIITHTDKSRIQYMKDCISVRFDTAVKAIQKEKDEQ